jgi:preprotein translocase subunit YajC
MGAYMLLIRQGRKKMDEEQDWIHDIVPGSQIESMNKNFKKIESLMDDGVSIVMSSDNQSAVELCQYWRSALRGEKNGWLKISSFIDGIIATIEEHLSEEGINPYEES